MTRVYPVNDPLIRELMKVCCRLFLLLVCACLISTGVWSQNTCPTALPVLAIPFATPNHTNGTILSPNQGYTTCGKVNDYTPAMACANAAMNQEDALFTFTPTAANRCVSLTLLGSGLGANPNLNASAALFVFDGCPNLPATNCIAQQVNTGNPQSRIIDLNLIAGRQYYIMVDGGTACFPYQLKIDPGFCSTTPGVSCLYPIEIAFPFDSVAGSTFGMGNQYAPGTGCIEQGNAGDEVVYHINITNSRCFRYEVELPTANGELYITKGCPGQPGTTCVRNSICRIPHCSAIVEEITLTPGDYYFILKSDNANALSFFFTLQSLTPDDNVTCVSCNDTDNCAPCKNSGFEKMNFQGWAGGYGVYATPAQTVGLNTGAFNDGITRHTIVTRGHYDSLVTALSVVPPDGGDYAVRLGNCNNGYQAEQLSYTIQVDSNNTNFIYKYAVVLEYPTPEHTQGNRPYFSIKMNVNGTNIACAEYIVYADTNIEGFLYGGMSPQNPGTLPGSVQQSSSSPIYYKQWTTVNIPLLNYIGQTATITFTTKDCNQGGHFGYAYVDARCERLEILKDSNLYCNHDTVHLTAPNGFVKYRWNTGDTTQSIDVSQKGTYTVTCTTVTGCVIQLTNEIKIEEPPIPNFTWKFDCKDSVVTFTDQSTPKGGNPITRWVWSFGDGDSSFVQHPKHKYTVSGDYHVTLTLYTSVGCSSDTMISIPIDVYMPQGNPNAIDTIRLCEKETLKLHADSIPETKYEWKGPNGFTSNIPSPERPNVAPKDSGWYKIKITIKDCVIKNDSTYVIIEPLKKVYITPDTIICEGDTAQLYCGGGKTYLWSPGTYLSGTTITNPKAFPPATTTFSVTMFNDLCPDTTLKVQVRVLSGVVSMQMPDTLRVCNGEPVQLQASVNGFDTFKWKGPAGFNSSQALPIIPAMEASKIGYYRLDCTISTNQCLIGADSTWVGLWPDPVLNITPDPAIICKGDSIQLTATGASTYKWSPNLYISNPNIANPWFFPPSTRNYVVTGTSIHGCKGVDSITVVVKPLPVPNLGPDITLCLGDTTFIKTTLKFDSLLWSTGSRADSIMIVASGNYAVRAWSNGCTATDTLKATFQDPGAFTLGPDTLLCEGIGYYTNITVAGVDSVRWNDNVTTLNRTITVTGTYYVDIYAGKCAYTDTIIVTFDSIPVFDLGPDSVVCIGSTVTLDASHPRALRYEWNTGQTVPVITIDTSGLYRATVYTVRCQYTDSMRLIVVDPPKLYLGPDTAICIGDSVQFTSNVTGDNYLWSTGATTPSIWASTTGDYSLIVTYGPCILYDTIHLFVQPRKTFNLGPDVIVCEDSVVTVIGPTGFDEYTWSSGENTKDIVPNQTGTYYLDTREGLCYTSDTIYVQFDTIPNFILLSDSICDGDSLLLTSPLSASNYLWSTGSTSSSIWISKENDYSLYIKNGKCDFKDTMHLSVVVPPGLYIGPDQKVCIGTGVRFGQIVSPIATYLWNTGDTSAIIEDQKIPQEYSVKVQYYVCEMRDTARLDVTYMPEPYLGPDQTICEGSTFTIFANTFGEKFEWNANSTSNTATLNQPGKYWVHVTNGYCENSDTVEIKVQPMHQVLLPPDVKICSGEKYDIVAVTNAKNPVFLWSNGLNAKYITVRNSGDYVLTVTDGLCEARDTIHVDVNPLPNVEPQYMLLCPDDSAIFHLPEDYQYYLVSPQSPFPAFHDSVVYPQIEYNLIVMDRNGCKGETNIKAELDMNCDRDVYVPNTFTPNADGENDVFRVVAYNLELIELLIFNRWGEKIFETSDPAKGWNGLYKNEMCKSDVYEWKLIYKDAYHRRKIKIGHVNLLK